MARATLEFAIRYKYGAKESGQKLQCLKNKGRDNDVNLKKMIKEVSGLLDFDYKKLNEIRLCGNQVLHLISDDPPAEFPLKEGITNKIMQTLWEFLTRLYSE